MVDYRTWCMYIFIFTYIPGTHLSFVFPPKQGLFQSKQGTFGFQVYIYIYYCVNSCHKATKDTCLSCLMLGLLQDIIYLSSHEQCIPSKLDLQVTKKCLFRPADNTRKDLWYPYLFIYREPRLKSWQIITVFGVKRMWPGWPLPPSP